MQRPWQAEHEVGPALARQLVERRFPDLAPVCVERLGVGWDNVAYLVNDAWVFRFPRRALAVELIAIESALLPHLAPRLPLAVPVPERLGEPDEHFAAPFAGYRRIAGRDAARAGLGPDERARAAEPLARFLRALHAVPADDARRWGAPPDRLGRLDLDRRRGQLAERLRAAQGLGLIDGAERWIELSRDVPAGWTPGAGTLVHGDLYAAHVLVDERGRPTGVIDWGDVHLGDPAIDLAIAHGLLPPSAREPFRRAYGPVDDDTWRVARFKAIHSAAMLVVYAHDVGDERLLAEARTSLAHLAA